MNPDTILDADTLKSIESSGKLIFHAVGDTGGVKTVTYQDAVSRFMECDLATLSGRIGLRSSIT